MLRRLLVVMNRALVVLRPFVVEEVAYCAMKTGCYGEVASC